MSGKTVARAWLVAGALLLGAPASAAGEAEQAGLGIIIESTTPDAIIIESTTPDASARVVRASGLHAAGHGPTPSYWRVFLAWLLGWTR